MPRFSIIIPVYNAERYLREALDSVLAQTFTDWECVCVDDGSRDSSPAILDEYAERDHRFRVIHQANGGEGVARNVGLRAALGEWITWLDADDIYAFDRLAEAKRIIDLEQPDLVRFGTYMGRKSDTGFGPDQIKCRSYRALVANAAKEWGWNVLMPSGMVWTWVARRDVLAGLEFVPGMRVKVDGVYSGYLANRLTKVVQSDYQAYFYRFISSSAIHGVRYADDCLRVLRAVRDLWQSMSEARARMPEKLVETMKCRLRMYCEDDIKDWVWQKQGESKLAREIYRLYLEVKGLGIFECPSIINWRPLEMALRIWDRTGNIWALWLVGKYVFTGRKIKSGLR